MDLEYKQDCRLFTGYKPCHHKRSCRQCPHYDRVTSSIALISLEALGAVLRSTCLLPALKRHHGPKSSITWITSPGAVPLLAHNPLIDRVIPFRADLLPALGAMEFDALYCVDKSLEAGGLAHLMKAPVKKGFGMDVLGRIIPLNPEADYQYGVGLDDDLKFFKNTKPETQQITESMGLTWLRDPYVLELTPDEKAEARRERSRLGPAPVLGFNTGCSYLYPYKKLTVPMSIQMVQSWRQEGQPWSQSPVLLLGGPEDRERNLEIKSHFSQDPLVILTPTNEGLRRGLLWMDVADAVFSGDSLGMHMGIALKKPVLAWFGVSCVQEIDLYDRGVKVVTEATCAPCWKKSCDKTVKCYDLISFDRVREGMKTLYGFCVN